MLLHRYGPNGAYLGEVEYNFELDEFVYSFDNEVEDQEGNLYTRTTYYFMDLKGGRTYTKMNFEVDGVMHHMPVGLTDKTPPTVEEGHFVQFSSGDWHVVDADPKDEAFIAELENLNRTNRLELLAASDIDALKYTERGLAVPQELLDYRQALRDISNQVCFPLFVYAPKKPELA